MRFFRFLQKKETKSCIFFEKNKKKTVGFFFNPGFSQPWYKQTKILFFRNKNVVSFP